MCAYVFVSPSVWCYSIWFLAVGSDPHVSFTFFPQTLCCFTFDALVAVRNSH